MAVSREAGPDMLGVAWLVFVFVLGACAGSLINVLVYRLPRGISVVWPPSRCPACATRLSWRDNIPILGWVLLGGRCRYCRAPISPQYPVIETVTATLFSLFFALCYLLPPDLTWAGVRWGAMRPGWALNDPVLTWPTFALWLILLGALLTATLVDARTFTIPLPVVWVPAAAGLIVHPLHAAIAGPLPLARGEPAWPIPIPRLHDWGLIGAAIGAMAGLVVSNALLAAGLIGRSFADYEQWERARRARASPQEAGQEPAPGSDPAMWVEYPHARREMVRELAFLGAPAALALGGWHVGQWVGGPWAYDPVTGVHLSAHPAPFWMAALAGALMGYLIGGGVVWLARIAGSLAFGREAMGLGDVHLMAAVGACLGWIDAVLAFFGAAFVGLGWYAVAAVLGGRVARMLPYGPFLAAATMLLLPAKPLVEVGLSVLVHVPVNLP